MNKINEITESELDQLMTNVAMLTEGLLPPGTSFVTIVFADPGSARYLSATNAERPRIAKAMRECADLLDPERDIDQ